MNDSREMKVLSLLSGLDESFIDEAQSTEKITIVRAVKKFPIVLAAVITALVVSAVGVTAAVQGYISHRKNVEHEYKNKAFVDELEKRQGQPIVAQNKHLRLTVDSIISDKIYIQATATLEGLDEQGKEYIGKYLCLNTDDFERMQGEWRSYLPFMKTVGADGKDVYFDQGADLMYGKRGEKAEGSFVFGTKKQKLLGAKTAHIRCFDLDSIDNEQGLDDLKAGVFDGLEFDLPLQTNFDTLTLVNEEIKPTDYLYISQVGYSLSGIHRRNAMWHGKETLVIRYTDGSEEAIYPDAVRSCGERLFELEKIKSVEYDGIVFKPQQLEKAEKSSSG